MIRRPPRSIRTATAFPYTTLSRSRFYAAEGAKVLQAYFHAAALSGGSLEDVLGWIADPHNAAQPEEVLRTHAAAAPFWDGLLRGALQGDDRRSEEHTSELPSLMRIPYAVFCLKKQKHGQKHE